MPKHSELIRASACETVERLKRGEIAPHDLLEALQARIGEVDGKVNALPTLCFDRARAHADRLMKKAATDRGLLAGMPVAIKDLTDVAGVRTTQGSPIFADHVPQTSDIVVEMLPLTTAPTQRDVRDRRGVLAWAFDAQPGEVKEIKLGWRLTWPADKTVMFDGRRM